MKINLSDIKRHGQTIVLGHGYTATEDYRCNPPELVIRKNGKVMKEYRGSSLHFSKKLTDEDRDYLISLVDE